MARKAKIKARIRKIKKLLPSDHLTRLALRMKKGDRAAAAKLYDELSPKLYGFVFTRTSKREVAEDLSQDIFLKLVEKIHTFDKDRGRFTVWFWQMARNVVIDYYRAKKETPFSHFDDEAVAAMAVTEMPDIEQKMQHDQLKDFVTQLEPEERELFELRYVVEMPYKEIAVVLAKSEGSLRVAALRIKEKVKNEFKRK
jgi:RNA polymerase sigma factor (sigma-70 family)